MRTVTKIVAYYRLSVPHQGKSKSETIRDAYGLEDQRRSVAAIAVKYNAPIIGEFTEIITGTGRKRRAELAKAISMARLYNATLVVSKQDRLARNARFVCILLKSGIDFISADHADDTRREILQRAIIDEEEAVRIADRTRRGIRIALEKGVKFGYANPAVEKKCGHLRGSRRVLP